MNGMNADQAEKAWNKYKKTGGERRGDQSDPQFPLFHLPQTIVERTVTVETVLKFWKEVNTQEELADAAGRLSSSILNGGTMLESYGLTDRVSAESIPVLPRPVMQMLENDDRSDALIAAMDPNAESLNGLPKMLCDASEAPSQDRRAPPLADSIDDKGKGETIANGELVGDDAVYPAAWVMQRTLFFHFAM